MDALQMALEKEFDRDGIIIIDGHYGHEVVDPEKVQLVIVLRRAPWELQEVLQNRLYSYDKVWENLDAEILGVIANEALEEYPRDKLNETNTTSKSSDESATEIMKVIKGVTPPSIEPIDWITYPETLRVLVNRTCTLS
jgi:broad-specificity NMP kinase